MTYSVIFDMDGVLVDSEPVINAAAIMGLSEYGVNARPEDFIPFIGTGEDRYIGGVAEKYGLAYKKEMKDRVYEIYLDIVENRIGIYEGVHQLLDSLRKSGIKTAVASSADMIKIKANLKAAGIDLPLFNIIIGGESVTEKKPSPEIYLHAARMLEASPKDCIVVEDAINGIRAAKSAGMKCIAVETSFSRDTLEKESPDYICTDIRDVKRLLTDLLKL